MKFNIFFVVFVVLTLVCLQSCTHTYINSHSGKYVELRNKSDSSIIVSVRNRAFNKLESAYVVDTLQFQDPIVVTYGRNYFLCERSAFTENKLKKNYLAPDMFMYKDGGFIYYLPKKEREELCDKDDPIGLYPPSDYTLEKEIGCEVIYSFRELPDYFLLIIYPVHAFVQDEMVVYTAKDIIKLGKMVNSYVKVIVPVFDSQWRRRNGKQLRKSVNYDRPYIRGCGSY